MPLVSLNPIVSPLHEAKFHSSKVAYYKFPIFHHHFGGSLSP
jgi:hypothetical protein